ncbi:MAG: preprotein translocase subunit SecE [Candidatus Algichlamydia australiensis]|nr:preprotein translocase subunit SecE [Chlamydiales bacterium]
MSVALKSKRLAEAKKRAAKGGFLAGIKEELKKVSWTTKEELRASSKIVISATFIFGIGIYVADLAMKGTLDGIAHLVRIITG